MRSASDLGRIPLELPLVLSIKLVLHPMLVFLLLSWLGGFDPSWVATAVLMSCLPPATNVFVIAQQYGTYVQRASSFVLIGTAVSIVTVTGFIWALTSGLSLTELTDRLVHCFDNQGRTATTIRC